MRGHDEWTTPQTLFDTLNMEFGFTLDAAASAENSKCDRFFSAEQDALVHSWDGEVVWCNPPYSGKNIANFLHKALMARARGTTSVFLLPAKTGNRWFHGYHFLKNYCGLAAERDL
jgi:site-specific DNA-methyltransferase (adenine-specific)